ncbi:MAG TPA: histidine kinase dimerization/phospho-acceptor domain-containing protein, partial [Sphingomicrobium sp.]
FRWECGPSGEIAWVEGAPRGALIGRSLARPQNGGGDHVDQEVLRAFAMRAPFRDAELNVAGDGLVSGEWKISGVPAFEPADGRFAGYRGIALREHTPAAAGQGPDVLSDPDSLRELVHEIKTPLNAIIGFAEIIEGQYLGPADRQYRERASEIVGQARMLLNAIDDLDFAAKAHSSEPAKVDVAELVETMASSLREAAVGKGVELELSRRMRNLVAAVEPELAARLIFRLVSAVIARGQKGERLRLTLSHAGDRCRIAINRPVALQKASDEELFGAAEAGEGMWLRLVRGLARIAGGDLTTTPAQIALLLPRG